MIYNYNNDFKQNQGQGGGRVLTNITLLTPSCPRHSYQPFRKLITSFLYLTRNVAASSRAFRGKGARAREYVRVQVQGQ